VSEHRYSLDELNARALLRSRELCAKLFGELRPHGGNIWMLSPWHSKPSWTSFSFNERTGVWKDFVADAGGKGALSLVASFIGGPLSPDHRRAIPWLKDFLGLTGREPSALERKALAAEIEKRERETVHKAEMQRRHARQLWLSAAPLDGTDPASLYLQNRGIDVLKLERIPGALRFHRNVYASDEDATFRGPYPCMLAAITLPGAGIVAVHRTYLQNDPVRGWTKVTWQRCKTGKQVKGAYAGGFIPLTRGKSGLSLRDTREPEWAMVGEGIEDTLTAALARPDYRALAAVSLSNLAGLQLPKAICGVLILKQNDVKPEAIRAFDRAMDALAGRGIEPAIVEIDPAFKDVNDVLRGITKSEAHAALA
jgi:hypothetical protein